MVCSFWATVQTQQHGGASARGQALTVNIKSTYPGTYTLMKHNGYWTLLDITVSFCQWLLLNLTQWAFKDPTGIVYSCLNRQNLCVV